MKPQSSSIADFDLPVFDKPQAEWWERPRVAWEDVMRQTAPFRDYYMRHHDSPERRLRDKNPAPFRLD
jgi:hypothetical protein